MKEKKSLARNYIYHLISQMIAVIVPLITTPYVSRALLPDGMGIYSYTCSIVTYFCLFGKLGLDVYGQLKIAEVQNDRQRRSAEFWGIFTAKTMATAIAGVAWLILILSSDKYRSMYIALSVCLAAQIFDITWLYQGIEEFREVALKNSLVKLLSVIFIFIFVKNKTDLVIYTIIVQGAVLVGNLSLWFRLKETVELTIQKSIKIKTHIRGSLLYFIPAVATSVYTMLDKSMIGWITQSEFENGYYEQAHKIAQILVTILTSLSTVMLPRLKYLFSTGNQKQIRTMIDKSFRLTLMLSVPMCTGILMLSADIIPWFLGERYESCIVLLQIFSLLMVIVGLNNIVGKQCLMAAGRQKYYNYGVVAGAIVNAAANCILIPRYASAGAAVASVLSETVILIIFIVFGRDYLGAFYTYIGSALKYFAASAVMGMVVFFIKSCMAGGILRVCAAGIAGALVYGAILLIVKDEFARAVAKKMETFITNINKR